MIIKIKNLSVETLLGAYAQERKALRPVIINLAIEYDCPNAVASDQLGDTLDYALIEQMVMDSVPKQTFTLLEALADHVAQLVLSFAGVREVTVEIDKPGALKYAQCVSVIHTARP